MQTFRWEPKNFIELTQITTVIIISKWYGFNLSIQSLSLKQSLAARTTLLGLFCIALELALLCYLITV